MEILCGLPPVVSDDSRTLILGTMPGAQSLLTAEYYAHPGNQFRRLVMGAFGLGAPASYDQFVQALSAHRLALWSVVLSCRRVGSTDSSMTDVIPNDLETFLDAHPRIDRILFESRRARALYERFFPQFAGIGYGDLPSASALYAPMSFAEKLERYKAELCRE